MPVPAFPNGLDPRVTDTKANPGAEVKMNE